MTNNSFMKITTLTTNVALFGTQAK